jgi:hypothetical protein
MSAFDAGSLALAERDYRDAAERAEFLRRVRNELVRSALEAGWTHSKIASATGLTRGRVGQIASAK